MSRAPLGFFDSGVGGTSVWKEVIHLLPHENTIYLADSKNAPYGIKTKEEIIALSVKNTEYLLSQGCKLIAVPCNTATTNAIEYLRRHYNIPFIGIEPAIKPAALQSHVKKVGVLATQGTLSSQLFKSTQERFTQDIDIIEVVGTGIVELIEAGKINSPEMHQLLARITKPFLETGIDFLVLGCSHYPYIKIHLETILPRDVKIIDSGIAVARQTMSILQQHDLLHQSSSPGHHTIHTNGQVNVIKDLVGAVPNTTINTLDF